jgi:hypothetical protein
MYTQTIETGDTAMTYIVMPVTLYRIYKARDGVPCGPIVYTSYDEKEAKALAANLAKDDERRLPLTETKDYIIG